MPRTTLAIAFLLSTLTAAAAWAQQPPDVVMTRDGGMVRGTIVEHVPSSHVVIQLATGETRQIDASGVTYAGPAAGAPGAAGAQAGGPGATGVRLRLVGDQPMLTFHRMTASATATAWGAGGSVQVRAYGFDRLCTAPCETRLPTGVQRLGLSLGDGDAIATPSLMIPGEGTLIGEYSDRTGIRVAGWLVFGIGVAAGLATMLVPIFDENLLLSDDAFIYIGVGAGLAILATVVGVPMAFLGDGAVIRFE